MAKGWISFFTTGLSLASPSRKPTPPVPVIIQFSVMRYETEALASMRLKPALAS